MLAEAVDVETLPVPTAAPRSVQTARLLAVLLLIVVAALMPLVARTSYDLQLLNEILIVGLLAMSLNLLLGYTGLISLGHAAFFGLGAYACALVTKEVYASVMLGLAASAGVSAVAAAFIGALCIRLSGFYFAMITLGFAQALFTVAYYWRSVTGGDDGMIGIPRPSIGVPGVALYPITEVEHFYYFTLAVLVVLLVIMYRIVKSPFGVVLQAIRENAERVQFLGLNVAYYKLGAFVLAGTFGGIAGGLFALFQGFISPELLYWSKSGEIVLMTVLGGMYSFFGPLVGTALLIYVRDVVLNYTDYWKIVVGAILVVSVLFMPAGIVGSMQFLRARLLRRWSR
jgi:branched-chain amino acid transport system permease protein